MHSVVVHSIDLAKCLLYVLVPWILRVRALPVSPTAMFPAQSPPRDWAGTPEDRSLVVWVPHPFRAWLSLEVDEVEPKRMRSMLRPMRYKNSDIPYSLPPMFLSFSQPCSSSLSHTANLESST